MEQINKKVQRFLELSLKFSKSAYDVFPENSGSSGIIYTTLNCGSSECQVKTSLSRAETIRANAEIEAQKAEEFDEYKTLQQELINYYTALNKLTKYNKTN